MKIKKISKITLSNRIVVDYGDREELVLLAVIDKETGYDYPLKEYEYCGFPIVQKYDGVKDFKELQSLNLDNKEGFVVKFTNGFRMKLKFDEYCRLHRIITNVTSYDIWDCLRNGTEFDEILNKVPDEFYDWVKETKIKLLKKFESISIEYNDIYSKLLKKSKDENWSDKDFAIQAKKFKNPSLLFSLKNNKSIDDTIWKMIKPKFEKPFSNGNEK